MQKLETEGYDPIFAYEEAIGFMNGSEIKDKDGVRRWSPPPPLRILFTDLALPVFPVLPFDRSPHSPSSPRWQRRWHDSRSRSQCTSTRFTTSCVTSPSLPSSTRLIVAGHTLRYGYHATSNSYFICRDPKKTDRIFARLRYGQEEAVRRVSFCRSRSLRLTLPARSRRTSRTRLTSRPSA